MVRSRGSQTYSYRRGSSASDLEVSILPCLASGQTAPPSLSGLGGLQKWI